MDNNKELIEKLQELKQLKSEVKEKIKSLEELESKINSMTNDFFSVEVPESHKYTYKRMKVIELQVSNIEKIHDSLRKYYDLLKDITEKETKIISEIEKRNIKEEDINITQEQFWLLLSKLNQEK